MPTVFRTGGFRFFYSNEGDPREPAHIHAERGDMEAKFWINHDVRVAYNDGFNAKALRELAGLVEANKGRIEEAWNGSFG
jgi:hypothetical protein